MEGVGAGGGLQDTFSDAVAARNFDSILTQTKAEYTARIHTLEAHARQLEAALRQSGSDGDDDGGYAGNGGNGGESSVEPSKKTVSFAGTNGQREPDISNNISTTGTQTGVMQTTSSTQTTSVGGGPDTKADPADSSARVRARRELLAHQDTPTSNVNGGSAEQVSVASASTALAAAYSKHAEQSAEIVEMRKALQNAADDKRKAHSLNTELVSMNQQWYAKMVQAQDTWRGHRERQQVRKHLAHPPCLRAPLWVEGAC